MQTTYALVVSEFRDKEHAQRNLEKRLEQKIGDTFRLEEVLAEVERFIADGEEPQLGALILSAPGRNGPIAKARSCL